MYPGQDLRVLRVTYSHRKRNRCNAPGEHPITSFLLLLEKKMRKRKKISIFILETDFSGLEYISVVECL